VPIVYEVPTHLNVEDTIDFGLGAHQLVRLAAAGSLAYLVWDQATMLPAEARLVVAGLLVAAGLLCALLQPGGRPLDRWVLAAGLYLLLPRRLPWRRVGRAADEPAPDGSGWAELSPDLAWAGRATASDEPLDGESRR
jgi:hypothetical protein